MKKAILWDMDGTLIDSEPAHHEALNYIAAQIGVIVPKKFHIAMTGSTLKDVYNAFIRLSGCEMDFEIWREKKFDAFKRYGKNILRCEPLASLAERLQHQNIPMCIASNSSREEVEFCLEITGLGEVISNYVCSNDVNKPKPDSEIYLLAASHLGVKPNNCLVVEDSIIGAQAGINAQMHVLYHPQHKVINENNLPKGLDYIPYDQSPLAYIYNFLKNNG